MRIFSSHVPRTLIYKTPTFFSDRWTKYVYKIRAEWSRNKQCCESLGKKKREGKKVKWSHYRPGVAQRVGRGIALPFHDCGTRKGWVVSSTPRPHFTHGKDPVPILQEAAWTQGSVWTGEKSRPHGNSIPARPACSQSLYRLSYRAH